MKYKTYDCDVTIASLHPPEETVLVFQVQAYSLQQCMIKIGSYLQPRIHEDDNLVIITGLSTNKP